MRLLKLFFIISITAYCNVSLSEISPGPKPSKAGELSLLIVASDSPEYVKEWVTTPPKHGVTIKRLKVARPNQLIVAAFLVSGMSPNLDGNYKFSVNFYLLGPDGKPVFGQRDYAKGSGKLPSNPTFIMADPALDLVLEQSDPEGIYIIVAQVTDIVTGKKAGDSYKLRFIKK